MSPETIEIQLGIPPGQTRRAVEIYYDAFRLKLNPISTSRERILKLLKKSLVLTQALAGLRGGQLVGLAGMQLKESRFMRWDKQAFMDEFGWLYGWMCYQGAHGMEQAYVPGQLYLEALAVDPLVRGQGVGSLLLQALIDLAGREGYQSVRLDVVDTNPRARQLYERTGFKPVRTHHYPWLRPLVGFGAETTLLYTLPE